MKNDFQKKRSGGGRSEEGRAERVNVRDERGPGNERGEQEDEERSSKLEEEGLIWGRKKRDLYSEMTALNLPYNKKKNPSNYCFRSRSR